MTNENESLELKSGFFVWKPGCFLRVSGADSLTFLQGQFTNDLRALDVLGAKYGLWLNHKGRVLGDSFIVRVKDAFWIVSYHSAAATIRERLEAYIIADDVVVEDLTADWIGVTMLGSTAQVSFATLPDAVSFPGRRGQPSVTEWLLPVASLAAARALLSVATEISAVEIERLRVAARIPAVPIDIGPGELPNEGGLDQDAISYTKGCYLGQEVMARLKSMGQVRRRLLPVRGTGEFPPLPAVLFQSGRRVGEVRSAVSLSGGIRGLALLSLLHVDAAKKLSFSENGKEQVAIDAAP